MRAPPQHTYTQPADISASESTLGTIAIGLDDLRAALARRELAIYLAWSETLARYRRSTLGPWWLVLGTALGVVGLGYVWSILFNIPAHEFIPSITVGLVLWQMIAGVLTGGPSVFTQNANMIVNVRLPTFLITLQAFSRHLINLMHNLLVVLVVFLIYPEHFSWTMFLAIPGLLIVSINLLAIMQILGIMGARFRDIEPLVTSLVPLLFFISPVIFRPHQLGAAEIVMRFNPIAQYLFVIREPLMGHLPSLSSYVAVLILTLVTMSAALWLTGSRAYRLPYWM